MYEQGKYKFKITAQGFTQAKSGNPQFFLTGKVTGQINPRNATEIYDCDNYERTIKVTITDNTIDRILSDLRNIGFTGSRFSELDPSNPKCHSFVGTEIDAECRHKPGRDDKSKLFEDWDFPYSRAPREAIASDKSVASKLDALFGKKLSEVNGGAKRAPAQRREPEPVSVADGNRPPDDEIPF